MKKMTLAWLVLLAVMLSTAQAENGLVAYWPFDTDFANAEGTASYDGVPAGTAQISAEDVKVGAGALKIDDDTTMKSHVTTLGDFVGPAPVIRTVVGWYKYADISGDGSDERNFIWETQPTYSLSFGIRDGAVGKYSQWYFNTDEGSMNGAGPTVDDGQWHHAVVVWNGVRGHVTYYHDGQLLTTVEVAPGNNPIGEQAGFNIGTHRSADGARNWDGYLDDIAIFSVELSENQVAALYNEPESINPLNVLTEVAELEPVLISPVDTKVYKEDIILSWDKSPVGNWTFDVYLGTEPNTLSVVASGIMETEYTPTDLTGATTYYWKVSGTSELGWAESNVAYFEVYQNQGLVAYWPFDQNYANAQGDGRYDGVELDNGNCVSISTEAVKRGVGALKINDNDVLTYGLVQIGQSPFFAGQKTMAITAWYKYTDIGGDGSTDRPFVFETAPNHTLSYGTRFEDEGLDVGEWYILGKPGFSDTTGPVDPDQTGWHHVALVYDAIRGSASFCFDGELRDNMLGDPYQGPGDGLAAHDVLNIGDYRGADGGRMFDGYIDDMAAYDVVLSAKQVKALYDGTYQGQTITPVNVLEAIDDVFAKGLYPVGEKIPLSTNLSWAAPTDVEAPEYRVYFGTDLNTVMNAAYTTTSETELDVTLAYGKRYYWRVDVVSGVDVFMGDMVEFATAAGLIAYYPFDTDFANAQGDSRYDGQPIGHVATSSEDVAVGSGALKIDDYTDTAILVTIEPSPVAAGQKQVTVTGWFKFKDIYGDGTDARPFVLESNDYHISYGTRWEDDMLDGGEWYFRGDPSFSDTDGPMITPDDPWHHFALVYDADAGYAEFYFDGELRDHYESSPGAGLNETTYINIGDYRGRNGDRNFDGYIDDVAFFDVILTADQIKAMHEDPATINGGNIMEQGL